MIRAQNGVCSTMSSSATEVVAGLRGTNAILEELFDKAAEATGKAIAA